MRSASPADYGLLADFLSGTAGENRSKNFWLRRFHWWWDNNPAYREGSPRGWLLSSNDSVVGFLGAIPSEVQLSGKIVTAFSTTTWRVEPTYRRYSLQLFSQLLRCGNGSVIFDTTPTDKVVRILAAYRFRLLPHADRPQSSVILLNPRRILETRIKPRWAAVVAASAGSRVWQYFQNSRLRRGLNSNALRVMQLGRADSTFDALWLRTRHLYVNTNVRSAAAVNWHCFGNDDFRKQLFGCFGPQGLLGYLIASGGLRNGLNILKCLDLWLDGAAPKVLPTLLAFLHDFAGADGYDLVEIPHFDRRLSQALISIGLLCKSAGEQRDYYRISDQRGDALSATSSYFVNLQGDIGL